MNLPPFPDEYIPTSPEVRLRLLQWGEECARMGAEAERLDAEGLSFDQLISALAQCRDMFPAPPHGSPIENAWAAAIADPLSVPGYIRGAIAARNEQQSTDGGTE